MRQAVRVWHVLLVTLCISTLVVPIVRADDCTEPNQVNCHVCASGGEANKIAAQPRHALNMAYVSNDLGAYSWFSRVWNTQTEEYEVESFLDDVSIDGLTGDRSDDTSPWFYIESIIVYFAFAIVVAIVLVVAGFSLCCGRYVYRCGCCPTCLACGDRHPTPKTKYLGYEMDDKNRPHYSAIEKWSARAYMGFFCFFIVLWMCMGQWEGNVAATEAMKAIANAPSALVRTIQDLIDPVIDLTEGLVSGALVGLLRDINITFAAAVQLPDVEIQITCMLDKVDALPNIDDLSEFLIAMSLAVDDLIESLDAIPVGLDAIQDEADKIADASANVSDTVSSTAWGMGNATEANNLVSDALDELELVIDDMQVFIKSIASDLAEIEAPSGPVVDAVTLVSIAKHSLLNPPNTDTVRQIFVTELVAVSAVYDAKPNFKQTALDMQAFNDRIERSNSENTFGNTIDAMGAAAKELVNLEDIPMQMNQTIQPLLDVIRGFNLDGMRSVLKDINASLYNLPDIDVFIDVQVQKIRDLDQILPCMDAVLEKVTRINETIMLVPDIFDEVSDIGPQINASKNDALASITDLSAGFGAFADTRTAINITEYYRQLDSMETEVHSNADAMNTTQFNKDLEAMADSSAVDFGVEADILAMNSTMNSNKMDPSSITAMDAYGTLMEQLKLDIAQVLSDMKAYQAAVPNRLCRTGLVDCSANGDADCSGDDQCLIDTNRFTQLASRMTVLSSTTPDSTGISAALEATNSSSTFDTTTIRSDVANATAGFDGVDTDAVSDSLDGVIGGLDEVNTEDILSSFGDTNSSLGALNLDETLGDMDGLNATFGSVGEKRGLVVDMKKQVIALKAFMYEGLHVFFDRLEHDQLVAARDNDGEDCPVCMLEHIAETADEMVIAMNATSDMFNIDATNFTGSLSGLTGTVGEATNPENTKHGHMHWVMNLASPDAIIKPGGSWNEKYMWKDADFEIYEDERTCYTDFCIGNTIDYYNKEPLDVVTKDNSLVIPVPFSRETVVGMPYLLPFFVILFGGLSALLSCKSKPANHLSTCFANCSGCTIWITMPIIFLLVGLVWPIIIILGDLCYGMENLGLQWINAAGDEMCTNTLSGEGTIEACKFPLANFTTIEMDVPTIYKGVFGGCEGGAQDPLNPVFDSLREHIHELSTKYVMGFANDTSSIVWREPMKRNFMTAASRSTVALQAFITDFQGVVGCPGMHNIIVTVKEAFCCDVMSAMYWAFGSWYLIAWTFCCCGCGANLFGRKRFRSDVFGRHASNSAQVAPAPKSLVSKDQNQDPEDSEHANFIVPEPEQALLIKPNSKPNSTSVSSSPEPGVDQESQKSTADRVLTINTDPEDSEHANFIVPEPEQAFLIKPNSKPNSTSVSSSRKSASDRVLTLHTTGPQTGGDGDILTAEVPNASNHDGDGDGDEGKSQAGGNDEPIPGATDTTSLTGESHSKGESQASGTDDNIPGATETTSLTIHARESHSKGESQAGGNDELPPSGTDDNIPGTTETTSRIAKYSGH